MGEIWFFCRVVVFCRCRVGYSLRRGLLLHCSAGWVLLVHSRRRRVAVVTRQSRFNCACMTSNSIRSGTRIRGDGCIADRAQHIQSSAIIASPSIILCWVAALPACLNAFNAIILRTTLLRLFGSHHFFSFCRISNPSSNELLNRSSDAVKPNLRALDTRPVVISCIGVRAGFPQTLAALAGDSPDRSCDEIAVIVHLAAPIAGPVLLVIEEGASLRVADALSTPACKWLCSLIVV